MSFTLICDTELVRLKQEGEQEPCRVAPRLKWLQNNEN